MLVTIGEPDKRGCRAHSIRGKEITPIAVARSHSVHSPDDYVGG